MATVNRPVNERIKAQDINNKLQLYGIYSAFSNGKVPSNKQVDIALNSALASKPLSAPSPKLSSEGKELVGDLRDVIQQAKLLLLSKNEGNLLQEFIYDTQHLEGGSAKLPKAATTKDAAEQHKNELLDGLKTLGSLILSNGQFRKLLNDSTILLRGIVSDAATQVASKVGPTEEQLAQIDQPAEDNTWHEAPDLSKQALRDAYNKKKPFKKQEGEAAAQEGADAAQAETDAQTGSKSGIGATVRDLEQQAQTNIPSQDKEAVKKAKDEYVQKSKNYLNEKIPEERRNQAIHRLKKMIVEIQGHSDYQHAIETLLSIAENYAGESRQLTTSGAGSVKGVFNDNKDALTKIKALIERFANYTSSDDLFDSIKAIYSAADRDPELKNWFTTLNKFLRRALQEQGYIVQDAATEEWKGIETKGRYLVRERYRGEFDHFLDEAKFFNSQFDQDPQNKAFAKSIEKLFVDLGRDKEGKIQFKPHLIKDLTDVIIPGIFENTRYIPIPRIEVSDPKFDAVVENLVIESDNLFPNVAEFGTDHYHRLGRGHIKNRHEGKILIAASGIQADIRDVAYYIKKKEGFPSLTDRGVLDIFLGGDGLSFKLVARSARQSDRTHFVVVDKVEVTVAHLAIKIKQSNHKLLFTIAKSILLKVLRPLIQKVVEKEIRSSFEKADATAWSIHQDAQKAIKAAEAAGTNTDEDAEKPPNAFRQYQQAFQKRATEKKEAKKKEKPSQTKVNISFTQHDSIFPDIRLPGGISTKATEYKDLAAKGDRWESPVFSIGNAKETTNLPKHAPVTRKHAPSSSATAAAGATAGAAAGTLPTTTSVGGTSLSHEVDQAFNNAANNASTIKPVGGLTNGNTVAQQTTGGY